MKYVIYSLIALGIIGGAIVLLKQQPSQESAAVPLVESTQDVTKSVQATMLQKTLLVSSAQKTESEEIEKTKSVYEGDTVSTLEKGRGILESENGTATVIDYSSEVVIRTQNAKGTHTSLLLSSGNVWARVKKVFGQGEFYEIETQNAVAVVRGTSFGVQKEKDGTTKILVSEGIVGVIPKDEKTGERKLDKEVKVPAGKKAVVNAKGEIIVSPLSAVEMKGEWYVFNNPPLTKVESKPITTTTPKPTATETPVAADPTTPVVTLPASNSAPQAAISITSVTPTKMTFPGEITIKGAGFNSISSVKVGSESVSEARLKVVSDSRLSFYSDALPEDMVGIFDVTVIDKNKKSDTLSRALTIERAPTQTPTTPPQETTYPINQTVQ